MTRRTAIRANQMHRAPQEQAARLDRSATRTVEESSELLGSQPHETARDLVLEARANSGLDSDRALTLAVEETRRHREGK